MATLPRPADMFGDSDSPVEIVERLDSYKAEMAKSLSMPKPVPGSPTAAPSEAAVLEKALGSADIAKALSPELVESVRSALVESGLNKDWTVGNGANGNPVATGLAAFDLEAPAKLLFPRPTPLRNRIARRRGIGLAHRFKRITAITGSGTGKADLWPGVSESAPQTPFGGQNGPQLLRGGKIDYAGDDKAVNYKQFGLSDSVSWQADFSGMGYQDIRQLSQEALLWSTMLMEEKMLLGARGTDAGFVGAKTPAITLAARAAGTGETALTGVTTNIYVKVVGRYMWGTSVLSSVATIAPSTQVVDVVVTNAESNGALSYDVYVATGASAPGADSGYFLMVSAATGSKITLQGALPTSGTAASSVTVTDTAARSDGYDGLLAYCTGSDAGYVKHINNTFVGSDGANVGNAFGTAFAAMYDKNQADPDEIFANGNDRKQLSDQLKTQGSSAYRINLTNDESHGAAVGTVVNAIYNPVTGKAVELTVHPYLPQGTMPIVSWTLPIPDSNVSDVFAVFNVQDYMGIQWPVIQQTYDASSYWYGTFVCYAPAWNGAIMGITKA